MVKQIFLLTTAILSCLCCFAQQFPFPMNTTKSYSYGQLPSNADNDVIQKKFVSWDKAMYKESTDGQYGRIRFDDKDYTVSEGIGYGMLIYVYMSNATNDFCQEKFDKLYAYYKKWSNGNGLMHWKIQGFESVNSYNAATDADLDVALALCLAAKQWGYSSNYVYADEAEIILNNIYKKEIGTHNIDGMDLKVINPGDSWNSIANPCYFTVASIGVFDQTQDYFTFSSKNDWKTVYNDCHTFLEKSQYAGLWPNWSNWDGSPCDRSPYDETSMDYGWDACRTPWRIAWDYLWFGNESSKNMMGKTINMMEVQSILDNPSQAGYYSNLSANDYAELVYENNGGMSAFSGGYACALMVDAEQEDNFNTYYDALKKRGESPYYGQTLQMLYLLVTSGNAINFFEQEECAPQKIVNPIVSTVETNGNTIEITCSKNLSDTIEDFSDFTLYIDGNKQQNSIKSMSISGTIISLELQNVVIEPETIIALSYNGKKIKSEQGGVLGSIVKYPVTNRVYVVGGNTVLADCEDGNKTLLGGGWYSYSDGSVQSYNFEDGANGTDSSVVFSYTDVKSYVGVGFNILNGENPLDCSGSTGITFYHKGSACILEAKTVTRKNANYSYQTYDIEAHEDWTLVELTWEEIAADFVSSGYVTELTGFQWKEVTGSGLFNIDEVTLIGRSFTPSNTDRSSLVALLLSANDMYSRATTEKYSQKAIDDFASVINYSADINCSPTASVEDLEAATDTLNTAISQFLAAAYGDKKSLEKAIETAELLSNDAIVGTEIGTYPQSEKDALDEAINDAKTAYETFGLTTLQVSAAVDALNSAVTKFNASVIKTSVNDIMVSCVVYPNPCVDVVNIESGKDIKSVNVIDTKGIKTAYKVNASFVRIDMSCFTTGIYVVQIEFIDGNTIVEQIIK